MTVAESRIEKIDAIVLCGGLGKRLRSVVSGLPKSMADIHGRPFLEVLIEYIASFGIQRFILCAGYKKEAIHTHFQSKKDGNCYVISGEAKPLGTGGALKAAFPLLRSSQFLVFNGDSFCRVDLNALVEFHSSVNATATLALASVQDARDFGTIALKENHEIDVFKEKDTSFSAPALVNAGIYLFERSVLQYFSPTETFSLESDLFPSLVGNKLYGYMTGQNLFDIGTPERLTVLRNYLQINEVS